MVITCQPGFLYIYRCRPIPLELLFMACGIFNALPKNSMKSEELSFPRIIPFLSSESFLASEFLFSFLLFVTPFSLFHQHQPKQKSWPLSLIPYSCSQHNSDESVNGFQQTFGSNHDSNVPQLWYINIVEIFKLSIQHQFPKNFLFPFHKFRFPFVYSFVQPFHSLYKLQHNNSKVLLQEECILVQHLHPNSSTDEKINKM